MAKVIKPGADSDLWQGQKRCEYCHYVYPFGVLDAVEESHVHVGERCPECDSFDATLAWEWGTSIPPLVLKGMRKLARVES